MTRVKINFIIKCIFLETKAQESPTFYPSIQSLNSYAIDGVPGWMSVCSK